MQKVKSLFKGDIRKYGMIIALVSITVLFQILTDGILLKPLNITNLILQNSYVLILAIGMLFPILTGNVDLSVGSIVAFVGAVAALLMVKYGVSVPVAVVISLVIGALIGAWQGFWIAYVKIPAFIVTLSGMLVFRGLTLWILEGQTIAPFPESFQIISSGFIPNMGEGLLNATSLLIGAVCSAIYIFIEINKRKNRLKYNFEVESSSKLIIKVVVILMIINAFTYTLSIYKGIPTVLILLAALIIIYSFLANKTIIGRHVYALGGNEKAAALSGVKTKRTMLLVYINMGILAALAGLVFAARLNAATPKAGSGFELDAIAACYIGGASAMGGIGTVSGAIVGGLVMGVLNNGMSILGIGIDIQQAIKGLVLLAAVAFDVYTKSKGSKVINKKDKEEKKDKPNNIEKEISKS